MYAMTEREEMLKEAQAVCNATLQQAQVVRDKAIEPFWQEYYSVVIVANQKYERAIAAYDAEHTRERPGQEPMMIVIGPVGPEVAVAALKAEQNAQNAACWCGYGDQDDQT